MLSLLPDQKHESTNKNSIFMIKNDRLQASSNLAVFLQLKVSLAVVRTSKFSLGTTQSFLEMLNVLIDTNVISMGFMPAVVHGTTKIPRLQFGQLLLQQTDTLKLFTRRSQHSQQQQQHF